MSNLANVGNNVWVGDYTACDEHSGSFEKVIHVWHLYQKGQGLCRTLMSGCESFSIMYSDGDPIARASQSLDAVAAFAGGEEKLLVHCAAGLCRGPTFALVAKIARGCDPYLAISDIYRGNHRDRGVAAQFFFQPIGEILDWAKAR